MVRRAGKHLVTTPEESGELRLCRPRQGQGLALQFRMSVIGERVASSVGRLMRNRPKTVRSAPQTACLRPLSMSAHRPSSSVPSGRIPFPDPAPGRAGIGRPSTSPASICRWAFQVAVLLLWHRSTASHTDRSYLSARRGTRSSCRPATRRGQHRQPHQT